LPENLTQGFLVLAPEPPEAVGVGADQAGPPQQRQVLTAGGFQFTGGTKAMEVAVEPDLQEQARGLGRTALASGRPSQAQGGPIQLIDKLAQEAGRVIGGTQSSKAGESRNCGP